MNRQIVFAPSILSANFANLEKEIKKCEDAGVSRLHLDIMDGHFVPNITIGPVVVEWIRKVTSLQLDTHLMIERPERYIDEFINAGSDLIAFHIEEYKGEKSSLSEEGVYPKTSIDMDEEKICLSIQKIKARGVKASLALNPPTPFFVYSLLNELDEILIMTVNPGFGGQEFIPSTLNKVKKVRSLFSKDIKVDGGVNEKTVRKLLEVGANVFVIGSYFFKSENPKEALKKLQSLV